MYVTEVKSIAAEDGALAVEDRHSDNKRMPAWLYHVGCVPPILKFQQEDRLQPQDTQNEEITENGQLPCPTFLEAVVSEFLRQKIMLQELGTPEDCKISGPIQLPAKRFQKTWQGFSGWHISFFMLSRSDPSHSTSVYVYMSKTEQRMIRWVENIFF